MTKFEIKYWTFLLLICYLPTIGFHLVLRPLWFADIDHTNITTIETLFTIIGLPIYLTLANYSLFKKNGKTPVTFIINSLVILSCIPISTYLHFKNWGDSTGRGDNPDLETIMVNDFERICGLVATSIGLSIVFVIIWYKNRRTTIKSKV